MSRVANNEGFCVYATALPLQGPAVEIPDGTFTSFSFNDRSWGMDKLELTAENEDLRWWDDPIFLRGNKLKFSWGYPSNVSLPRTMVIRKVSGFTSLKIEAYGQEGHFHADKVVRTFRKMSVAEVVTKIARENGFSQVVVDDVSGIRPERLQQTRETDAEFLQRLAGIYGCEWYIEADGLFHFRWRDLDQEPLRTFYWRGAVGAGSAIVEEPEFETSILDQPGAVQVVAIDHAEKKVRSVTASGTTTARTSLGDVTDISDGVNPVGRVDSKPNRRLSLAAWHGSLAEAKERADAGFRLAQSCLVKAKLRVLGDPHLKAKSIVRLEGFGVLLSGNYYVTEANHKGGGSYTTELTLRRDAFGKISPKQPKASAKTNEKEGDTGFIGPPEAPEGPRTDPTGRRGMKFIPDAFEGE